mgnify:FL=1
MMKKTGEAIKTHRNKHIKRNPKLKQTNNNKQTGLSMSLTAWERLKQFHNGHFQFKAYEKLTKIIH